MGLIYIKFKTDEIIDPEQPPATSWLVKTGETSLTKLHQRIYYGK